jgi:signal peptidase I
MAPTIGTNQMLVADLFAYRSAQPHRDDVVLFMPPVVSDAPWLKRVVAVPGDRFAIRGGRTFVNGNRVAEP